MPRSSYNPVQIVAAVFLLVVFCLSIFVYGIAVGNFKYPPYPLFLRGYLEYKTIAAQLDEVAARNDVATAELPFYYKRVPKNLPRLPHDEDRAYQGVNLITRIKTGSEL